MSRVFWSRRPSQQFAQIPNAWLRDMRLSHRARGILALLCTHEDGFEQTLKSMTTSREGADAVLTAVRELQALGYIERRRHRNEDGTLGSADWIITGNIPE